MAEHIDLFSTPQMSSVFSDEAHVQAMLTFEVALARAEARAGLFSREVAQRIEAACRVEYFDVDALYREALTAGTLAIPLVRMLTAQVEGDAKKFVHWGATSQDAIDTALMLQMRQGLDLLIDELYEICNACATLADHHRHTLMVGRTLLQQAVPITFGLKSARWLSLVLRQLQALSRHREQTLAIQFGGAAGTLASLGENGLYVTTLLAEELGLPAPEIPWHTERDRIADIGASLGIVAGSLSKIGTDLVLLAQTEVGEVSEGAGPGKGGSSAMPQKRNPVDGTYALAATRLALGEVPVILSAMTQEHERAVGGWQAEWRAIPNLFCFTACAVEHIRLALQDLQVNIQQMSANVDITHGLIMAESLTMALAKHVGKSEAHALVQTVCAQAVKSGEQLKHVAPADPKIRSLLSDEEIDVALNPANYLGSTTPFIDRALAAFREFKSTRGTS